MTSGPLAHVLRFLACQLGSGAALFGAIVTCAIAGCGAGEAVSAGPAPATGTVSASHSAAPAPSTAAAPQPPAPRQLEPAPPGAAIFRKGQDACFIHGHPPCPQGMRCADPPPPMMEIQVQCPPDEPPAPEE